MYLDNEIAKINYKKKNIPCDISLVNTFNVRFVYIRADKAIEKIDLAHLSEGEAFKKYHYYTMYKTLPKRWAKTLPVPKGINITPLNENNRIWPEAEEEVDAITAKINTWVKENVYDSNERKFKKEYTYLNKDFNHFHVHVCISIDCTSYYVFKARTPVISCSFICDDRAKPNKKKRHKAK